MELSTISVQRPQKCVVLFPSMAWNGETPRLALERRGALGVLAKVLEKWRPEGLDSRVPEWVRHGSVLV